MNSIYTQHLNLRHGLVVHLIQGRYEAQRKRRFRITFNTSKSPKWNQIALRVSFMPTNRI